MHPRPPSPAGLRLHRRPPLLIAALDGPHRILSSAPLRGGLTQARAVAWLQVRDRDLPPELDPIALLRDALTAGAVPEAVGMMTGRSLRYVHTAERCVEGLRASAVVTVGLSNALRVGDPPGPGPAVGTINLLLRLSIPLSDAALVEAVALAAEARTAAVLESGWASSRSAAPATGTGTDCIAIAAPLGPDPAPWCGKHTAAGSALGAAALTAVEEATALWLSQARGAGLGTSMENGS